MSSGIQYFVIDAFAEQPFEGNPAAVCLLDKPADARWMQLVAREMNLSETAFVSPRSGGFDLRWFTPTVEVELCGHATLASAHALWTRSEPVETSEVIFFTKSGELRATREAPVIALDFPAKPAALSPAPEGLVAALGCNPIWIGKSAFDYLCELESEAAVRALAPNLAALARVDARGVIVTARGSGRFDFISRFFAPRSGVDEDPVTGSAHCTLAPFWAARLNKREMLAWQASKRGGSVGVRLREARVELRGRAWTIAEGRLRAI